MAYSLLSTALLDLARVLYVCTQPVWTWYTHQVETVKNPSDHLQYLLAQSAGKWASEPRLVETIRHCFSDSANLRYMRIHSSDEANVRTQLLADRTLELTMYLLAERLWSATVRYAIPPEQYVELLSQDADRAGIALGLMKRHWQRLQKLEHQRFNVPVAELLWKDINIARSAPIRLIYMMYERAGWSRTCDQGRRHLNGLLRVFPDNKIVEDVHGKLRFEAEMNPNCKLMTAHMQQTVVASGVFELRGIRHAAAIDRATFLKRVDASLHLH